MLSEKTVELNLTAEYLQLVFTRTRKLHYAIGPTQRQEGRLGFDVRISGTGGVLVQYKRAYVDGHIWTWKLNRTKLRDQHLRLQTLQHLGFPVFYGFPFFHTEHELAQARRRLLAKTFWFKPFQIQPDGGPVGHHEVRHDSTTGRWWVNPGETDRAS